MAIYTSTIEHVEVSEGVDDISVYPILKDGVAPDLSSSTFEFTVSKHNAKDIIFLKTDPTGSLSGDVTVTIVPIDTIGMPGTYDGEIVELISTLKHLIWEGSFTIKKKIIKPSGFSSGFNSGFR